METPEALIDSIKQYESQLAQVKVAISSASEGSDRDDLISLQRDIEELLHLTKENLETLNNSLNEKGNQSEKAGNDPYADEYELFRAELAALDSKDHQTTNSENDTNNINNSGSGDNNDDEDDNDDDDEEEEEEEEDDDTDIQSELNDLLGSKCQAPYTNKSGGRSYHNALVSAIETSDSPSDMNDIKVRVLFTNPVEKEMIPCPYFLDNKCNFGEIKCKFSHGNLIPLSQLQEFKEPDFKLIKQGCRVLAKTGDSLWKSAVVEDVVSDEACAIKIEGRFVEVPVHDLLPLTESKDDAEDSDLSETEDSELVNSRMDYKVEMSLTREQPVAKLGEWEKYTKGIGSKLMAKMGYVVGCGLGKAGEGRLDPVEATILPVGKSLDHCMNLKEAAGGTKDLFSAERIQRRLALRELRKSQRRYERQKKQANHDVFNIINKLSSGAASSSKGPLSSGRTLKKKLSLTTGRELNVERLKLAENMRQTQRNIHSLKESLTRQKEGSVSHKNLLSKLNSAQGQLAVLQNMDSKVAREQNLRETKKKMTIF